MTNEIQRPSSPLIEFSGLPVGMGDLWTNGFNAKTQRFSGGPLFELSFLKGKFIKVADYAAQNLYYQIPDHISVNQRGQSTSHHLATTVNTQTDFEKEFGFSLSASGDDEFFSMSGESEFSFQGDIGTDVTKSYEISFFVCRSSSFTAFEFPPLNSRFVDDLNQAIKTNDLLTWGSFFEKYGTHFIVAGDMGGLYAIQASVDSSLYTQTGSQQMHASFTADFDDFISSGSLSISAYKSQSSFYLNNQQRTEVRAYSRGGVVTGGFQSGTLDEFYHSCVYNPTLLMLNTSVTRQPKFRPLSDLFDEASIASAVSEAIKQYLSIPRMPSTGAGTQTNSTIHLYQQNIAEEIQCDQFMIISGEYGPDLRGIFPENFREVNDWSNFFSRLVPLRRGVWTVNSAASQTGFVFPAFRKSPGFNRFLPSLLIDPLWEKIDGGMVTRLSFDLPGILFLICNAANQNPMSVRIQQTSRYVKYCLNELDVAPATCVSVPAVGSEPPHFEISIEGMTDPTDFSQFLLTYFPVQLQAGYMFANQIPGWLLNSRVHNDIILFVKNDSIILFDLASAPALTGELVVTIQTSPSPAGFNDGQAVTVASFNRSYTGTVSNQSYYLQVSAYVTGANWVKLNVAQTGSLDFHIELSGVFSIVNS